MRPYRGTGRERHRATVVRYCTAVALIFLPKGENILNKKVYQGAIYQGFPETQQITGLPRGYLQRGLDAGIFPAIRSGNRVLFNVPRLMEVLEQMSTGEKEGVQQ